MTTTVSLYRTLAASLTIPHTRRRTWADAAPAGAAGEATAENGPTPTAAGLEAPHYAMGSLDHMVGA
ncbi:MAG UNVERIFIED_CONTAM: hypothetical protein LVR18_48480 [Planctomycetaceae bacterium]